MSDTVRASLLMVAAMGFFAAQDVFIKLLSVTLGPGQLVLLIAAGAPILAGAAVWFAEPVGWRRWTAIAVGMAGVLMVLRPGVAGFDPAMLWAVGGAVAMAAIALVVGSGLYTLFREARLRRAPVAAPSLQTPPGL